MNVVQMENLPVNPDHVCTGEGDSITAPDVVRVQLGDLDVLNDDVGNTAIWRQRDKRNEDHSLC